MIKVLTKITIKHKTMMKCEVKSNFMIRLGAPYRPPRPRRPLAFVQPCPMGATPLTTQLTLVESEMKTRTRLAVLRRKRLYFAWPL